MDGADQMSREHAEMSKLRQLAKAPFEGLGVV